MATSWTTAPKPAQGWTYNQVGITYNAAEDPVSGNQLFYNAAGEATTWTAVAKS